MKLKKFFAKLAAVAVVLILAVVLVAPAAQAATPAQIQDAIDDGLAWLAGQQNADGSWGGSWSNQVARTGLAVLKFETHAIFQGLHPLDAAYTYSGVVTNGLNYIFNNSASIPIFDEGHGNPDIHPAGGNGQGVYCYVLGEDDFHRVYESGIALMAICASWAPTATVAAGPQAGRTYEDVAGDIVDYLAFAQENPATGVYRGGWRYYENFGSSDNSISGYATLGLSFAEAPAPWGFSLAIPAFVFPEMDLWIDYVQTDQLGGATDGGSGYSDPDNWVNILKTGNLLSQMALYGNTQATQRVKYAVEYMGRTWNQANDDPGWKGPALHYQACFTTMKGFQALGITQIDTDGDTVPDTDWYADMADAIVNSQNADGSWPGDYWGDSQLTTAWAMLTLEKAAPPALILTPPFDANPVGTSHTVTALYEIAGVPQVGVQINFEVIAGPNVGDSGSDTTDVNGEATFTYTGDGGIGTDTIRATAVDAAGAPLVSAEATKDWNGNGPGPQVPSMTGWGILAAGIILAVLIPLALRRRKLSSTGG